MFNSQIDGFAKEVVFLGKIELRLIPGYAYAYAGSDGRIRLISPCGKIVHPTVKEFKTTKGTYLYVNVITDEFRPVTKAVHQLVCMAFHGKPTRTDMDQEPNHLDGDKHNNVPSNLEWTTHRSNVQHAFNEGLSTQGLRIEVTDVLENKVFKFNTLSHCGRELNISRGTIRDVVNRHIKIPYRDRYVFKVDKTLNDKVDRWNLVELEALDYVKREAVVYKSLADASTATKVKLGTIRSKVFGERPGLISGYIFRGIGEFGKEWPEFTDEEIKKSLEKHPRVE